MLLDRLFKPASASEATAPNAAPAASSAPMPRPRAYAQRRALAERAGNELAAAHEAQLSALSAQRAEAQSRHAEGLAQLEREAVESERSMLAEFIAAAHAMIKPLVDEFTSLASRPSVVQIGSALRALGARELIELPPTPSRTRTVEVLVHALIARSAESDPRILNVFGTQCSSAVVEIATRIDRVLCACLESGAALDTITIEAQLRLFELAISELLRSQSAPIPEARARWAIVMMQDAAELERFDRAVRDAAQALSVREWKTPPSAMKQSDGSDADEHYRSIPLDRASTSDLVHALDAFR